MEEYNSITKKDVWEVIPRPEGKSVVTSRWLYKLKHAADGNIEKYKLVLWLEGFHRLRESTMMRPLHWLLDILRSGQ
jgi:hypothetical protein